MSAEAEPVLRPDFQSVVFVPVKMDIPEILRLAATREYFAELDDGSIVDLADYVMSAYDPNMGGFFKKIFKKIKRAFKKPLTRILPYVGLAVGIAPSVLPATLATKLAASPIVAGLAKANKVIELAQTVKSYVQAGGIEPTQAEVNETVAQIMQQYPSVYTPTPTVPAPAPVGAVSPYEKYIPWAIGITGATIVAAVLASAFRL